MSRLVERLAQLSHLAAFAQAKLLTFCSTEQKVFTTTGAELQQLRGPLGRL
jgi:hypothetical protein